jgi:hypothetical protein
MQSNINMTTKKGQIGRERERDSDSLRERDSLRKIGRKKDRKEKRGRSRQ